MVAARPRVRRRRQVQHVLDGEYTRTELARGDTKRRRKAREQAVHGRFIGGTITPAGRAKLTAKARKQPRDVLGRFRAIARKEANRVFNEAMGIGPKKYAKPPKATRSSRWDRG
jgi:hypothetical protein